MSADGLSDDAVRQILISADVFAVVGASVKPDRPSYGVMAALVAQGYDLQPINPGNAGQMIHGYRVRASLADCTPTVDVVDIFRNSDAAADAVEDAVRLKTALGITTLWMQLGVVNEAAALRGRAAGLTVVMDRCPKIEIARLGLVPKTAARPSR